LYAIIDIETTGQSAAKGKITEIAIYIHNGFEITDSFSSLINPECYIPEFITSLTGIDNEMVRNAPKFYEVARQIVEITQDKIFVAHNVSFDYKFIQEEFKRLGYDYQRQTMCTVRMGRKYIPGHRSYSLGKICDELGISINGRHRAAGDALATTKLLEIILSRKALKDTKLPPSQLRLF
jgi:DNA polymerase III subunit epsilon